MLGTIAITLLNFYSFVCVESLQFAFTLDLDSVTKKFNFINFKHVYTEKGKLCLLI